MNGRRHNQSEQSQWQTRINTTIFQSRPPLKPVCLPAFYVHSMSFNRVLLPVCLYFLHIVLNIHPCISWWTSVSVHSHVGLWIMHRGKRGSGRVRETGRGKRVKPKINVFCLGSMFERGKFRKTSPGPLSSKPFYVCACVCAPRHLSVLSVLSALCGGAGGE